jgi:flavorubredoxin
MVTPRTASPKEFRMFANATTRVDEIADGLFRISTALPQLLPTGFTFNQFLIKDERPLLFHAGPRSLFDAVRQAVATVLPPEKLAYIGYSHLEADECGSLNQWLELAPGARPVCSKLGAFVCLNDSALRPALGLAHGETLELGARGVTWLDAPHLPHGMDTGYLFEKQTRTLLCGDLFCQPGHVVPPVTEGDIFGPSEVLRQSFPYAPVANARQLLERLAATQPSLLACMHGSSYRGDGASLLRALGAVL